MADGNQCSGDRADEGKLEHRGLWEGGSTFRCGQEGTSLKEQEGGHAANRKGRPKQRRHRAKALKLRPVCPEHSEPGKG